MSSKGSKTPLKFEACDRSDVDPANLRLANRDSREKNTSKNTSLSKSTLRRLSVQMSEADQAHFLATVFCIDVLSEALRIAKGIQSGKSEK